MTTGSPDVVVGVLDSGISSTHPDLVTQIAKDKSASCLGGVVNTAEAAWNPTTSSHGTHVAGTIAAAINGVGIAGVAPGVKVASVKVVTDAGFIYPEAAVCGFVWAADHGMQITNNSYFIDPWEFNCRNDARQRPVWQAVQRAIRYSQSKGVLTVASAGNSNVDLQHKFIDERQPERRQLPRRDPRDQRRLRRPARRGAGRRHRVRGRHAATEELLLVVRPGRRGRRRARRRHATAEPGRLDDRQRGPLDGHQHDDEVNGWGYLQGTSMASPHAAGVAALALSTHPGLQPGALASFLERTAEPLPCPEGIYNPRPGLDQFLAECTGGNRNGFYGAGEVNAVNAVK